MKNTLRFLIAFVSILLLGVTQSLSAIELIGKVADETGDPLPGVTIKVKGSKVGTISNIDGAYSLNVDDPSAAKLVFTFIGLEPHEEEVGDRKVINVKLQSSSVQLKEVVAVGYGNMSRKDLTGSVVSVDAAEMVKVPTSDVTQALAGRVSGLLVSQTEGAPGSPSSIRIRGGMSITGNNDPLYIIDGFPSENGLSNIDPASITSIDVLKDASSTAIYGARGANGVIVVTTKSGTPTKTTVSYDGYWGVKKAANQLATLSPKEFVLLDYERRTSNTLTRNPLYGSYDSIPFNYNNRPGISFQNEIFGRNAFTQNHRISIDGGEKKLRYNLSYTRNTDEGQMIESGQTKDNVRLKVDHEINDKLKVTANASYTDSKVTGLGTSGPTSTFTVLGQILQYRPTTGIVGNDQDLLTLPIDPILIDDNGNVIVNPIVSAQSTKRTNESRNLQLNGGFTYTFMKGLAFQNTTGVSYTSGKDATFYGSQSITARRASIQGSVKNSDGQTTQMSNTLTYTRSQGKHRFTMLLGQEFINSWSRSVTASAFQFPNDDIGLNDMSLGAMAGTPQSNFIPDVYMLSFFSRAYYNYADKYMLTATMRADGSSKFAKKWGQFPSASIAWRASEEPFIKELDLFSDLKVRFGFGYAGNNRIGSYGSLPIMGSVTAANGAATQVGFASTQIPNPNLQWEANQTKNLGVDIGFLNHRVVISPEFYINNSSQLLLSSTIPNSSGFPTMVQNIGRTENRGFDLTIKTVNVKSGSFEWTSNLTLSQNQNKILELSGEQSFLRSSQFLGNNQAADFIVKVGEPLGQMYGYKVTGLYQVSDFDYDPTTSKYTLKKGIAYDARKAPQPGYWKYQDANGDSLITDADRQIIGHSTPLFYGGVNNTFIYKNFDLSVFVNFSYGGNVLNATKLYSTQTGANNRNALDIANSSNRWVTVDATGNRLTDPTALAALNVGKTVASYANMTATDNYITSWDVEDASFLRINNVTLGYSLPKPLMKKLGIEKLRFYATANNLYVFTKYTGLDPEVSTRNPSGLTPNVDWSAYPRSRVLTLGVNLIF